MAKVTEKSIAEQLRPIFEASSMAVIGASESRDKFGGRAFYLPLETGYRGAIYPVNPTHIIKPSSTPPPNPTVPVRVMTLASTKAIKSEFNIAIA